jgi:hypothetical protein
MYGYLQQGRIRDATATMKTCHAVSSAQSTFGFLALWARYLIDTEDWAGEVAALSLATELPGAALTSEFVAAFGAARCGDLARARQAHAKLQAARRALEQKSAKAGGEHAGMPGMSTPPTDIGPLGRARVLDEEIAAMVRFKEGAAAEAIAALRKAAAFEETLPLRVWTTVHRQTGVRALGRAAARKQSAGRSAGRIRKGAVAHARAHRGAHRPNGGGRQVRRYPQGGRGTHAAAEDLASGRPAAD